MTTTTSPAGRRLVLGAAVVAGVAVLGLAVVLLTRPAAGDDAEPTSAPGADGTPAAPSAAPSPSSTPTASPSPSPSPVTTPSGEPDPEQTPAADTRASTSVSVVTAAFSPERAAIEVSGLADVVEAGGTCTLVVSLGSATATATAAAEADATSTSCGTLAVPRADIAPGRWSAVLRYDSATTTGTSAPVTIEVPA